MAGLARSNLVQQGGELAYLIRHDPEFRGVRREHLIEAGRRVRLKSAIPALVDFMERGTAGYHFSFFVISAAPREIVISALAGMLPAEHIYGTELEFDSRSGEVRAINRVPAGYGKVAVIEELEHRLGITPDRMIYVGDGGSDVHVMLHVNNHDGFTIAVSENKQLARIAKSMVLSDNAFSIMVPILDQLLHWRTGRYPRSVRVLRPDAERMGEGPDRSGEDRRISSPSVPARRRSAMSHWIKTCWDGRQPVFLSPRIFLRALAAARRTDAGRAALDHLRRADRRIAGHRRQRAGVFRSGLDRISQGTFADSLIGSSTSC